MSINTYFLRQEARPKKRNPGQASMAAEDANPANVANIAAGMEHGTETDIRAALRDVVHEVTTNVTKAMDEKFAPILELLKKHGDLLESHEERLDEAERRIGAVEDTLDPVKTKVEKLEKTVDFLIEHVDDLENRGRRMNIRVLNLPEGAEGTNPTRFFERWLPEVLHIEGKGGQIKLERAHRSLAPKPPSTQRPRPVLVRFHNYQDKQRVMNASWELARHNQVVKHGGSTVMFFQDFSVTVARKRKGYKAVKKRLRSLGVEYRLIYPAKLKVTYRGSSRVFNNPAKAEDYADAMDEAAPSSDE